MLEVVVWGCGDEDLGDGEGGDCDDDVVVGPSRGLGQGVIEPCESLAVEAVALVLDRVLAVLGAEQDGGEAENGLVR